MHEVEELSRPEDEGIRKAKEVLAYEATKICHGHKEADRARSAAGQLFGEKAGDDLEGVPTYSMSLEELGDGIEAYILFQNTSLCRTRSQARRLISQGGAYVNGERIPSFETKIGSDYIRNNAILLRAGKKRYLRVRIQDS